MNINDLFEKAIRDGESAEKELFEALLVRFRAIVHQRIWEKNDSEDVAQEALLAVAREYKGIKFEISFSAWAAKVLDYRILAYIKRKRTTQARVSEAPPEDCSRPDLSQSPGLRLKLLKCLKELFAANPRYARIINLHYQGYSIEEVCRRLKIKAGNSYVILSRAREMLAKCLGKRNEVES
ncbi:MAG: RNA polymerase sigma factor [Candidatus Zixiibacteriota bacterium]